MPEVLEEKISQPKILDPAKLFFRKAERLPQTQKLREFIIIRATLQEILKGVQAAMKGC